MGFQPFFNNGISPAALWFSPNMAYYIPNYQGMTPLTSPSMTPNLITPESGSYKVDGWSFNHLNSPFNDQNKLFLGQGSIPDTGNQIVKEEEKSSNNETVNQIQPVVKI